ncbi:hypothetical protein [Thermovibrio sp.]
MRTLLSALVFLALTGKALSQEMVVLTKEVSIREVPKGEIVEVVDSKRELPLTAVLDYWGMTTNGWVNLDFTNYTFPSFKETGELQLKVGIVVKPTEELKENDAVYIYKEKGDKALALYKNRVIEVPLDRLEVREVQAKIVVSNFPLELTDGQGEKVKVKGGTPLLESPEGFLYKNHLWSSYLREKEEKEVNKELLLKKINRLIDIFNSVKLSSPLSERIGYYLKTLPVKSDDLTLIKTPYGIGAYIKLKYRLTTRDGQPIEGRKSRFILKKSNYEFWRRLSTEAFKEGINKFVEIDIYRFDGENSFEPIGFVASSYHEFKDGMLKDYKSFLENSESNISEDAWFFADQVYERLEDGD